MTDKQKDFEERVRRGQATIIEEQAVRKREAAGAFLNIFNQEIDELSAKQEEQIEEMAKDIPYLILDREVFVSATEKKNISYTLSEEDNKLIAKHLVSKGWIKPDENTVALTKEEWKQIKNSLYYSEEALEKKLEKARKETAEKILNKQYQECKIAEQDVLKVRGNNKKDAYYMGFSLGMINTKMYIRELAEQLGVDIKED